jgi:ATP-dependent helicase/nuclease subunit A
MDIQALRQTHLNRQNSASNPKHSVWVSANAGAGKTHILVERIIRLLLPPYHTVPHKILCITYTKAAASEMTERLFQRLGSWIGKTDKDLSDEMTKMMGYAPTSQDIVSARRLFARSLEATGGLKIQTIHGFCEHILRQFPIETEFSKDFTLLSDDDLRQLYLNALKYLSLDAIENPNSTLDNAFKKVSYAYNFSDLIDLLINSRKIYALIQQKNKPFLDSNQLIDCLGLPKYCDSDTLFDDFFNLIDDIKISSLISALQDGGVTENNRADKLRLLQIKGYNRFSLWEDFFLNSEKDAMLSRSRFITKKFQEKYSEHANYLYQLYDMFAERLIHRYGFNIYNLTKHVSLILQAVYEYVDAQKQTQSLCDFDDIIVKTRTLLTNNNLAPWVLWKLDGGIDHILVDEAQDTSSEQWDIIRALSQEFFSSDKEITNHRTIFAVGDEKQSIYGFQGAAPEKMAQNADYFQQAINNSDASWTVEYLRGSFRSSPAIMKFVDSVFQSEAASGVLFGNAEKIEHYAVAHSGPGYVEIMPPVIPVDHETQNAWDAPLDSPAEISAASINAQNIANKIQSLLQSSTLLPSTGSPVEPKDIMILLQRRDATMQFLIRALKRFNIPVSGLDRINLLNEIAVLDLLSVIDFVLFPDDDLTLAQILRSPLCALTEQDIFDLAHNRTGQLWQVFCLRSHENSRFQEAYEFLTLLLNRADFESPYTFLSLILENQQGRKKFIARLGADCIDGLDELLNKAIDFSTKNGSSLQKFVHHIRHSGSNQKREIDNNNNKIQIMTIHGSKGLEAPIVFLPNCCDMPRVNADLHKRFIVTSDYIPMIIKEGGNHPIALEQKAFLRKKEEDENRRLLYVALTRAKDWLFISGKLSKSKSNNKTEIKIPENSWYDYSIKGILGLDNVQKIDHSDGTITYIYQDAITENNQVVFKQKTDVNHNDTETIPLPDWILTNPFNRQLNQEKMFVTPSTALKETTQDLNPLAKQKGVIIHRLLELLVHIKPDKRQQAADNFLKNYNLPTQHHLEYIKEVFKIIDNPQYALLLSADGLSEVPIIGHLKNMDNMIVSGQIDRMVITPTDILIADYKTDRHLTDISHLPPQYILQMALYKEALQEIYPNKPIKCFILATTKPEMILLSTDLLNNSLNDYRYKLSKKIA